MNLKKVILSALLSSAFLVSCTKDSPESTTSNKPLGTYDKGVLILNQGGFNHADASMSYLSGDLTTLQNDVFTLVNPTMTLGDTAQDVGFYNNLAFIVVNASNKIEVVNRYTLAHVATITTGLNNPRYIAFANGKGYVTNWGDGTKTDDDFVAVIDPASYSVSSTISVVEGPEAIAEYNGKLYVAHAGGYNFGNTISVINSATNLVLTTIAVGDVPDTLVINNSALYVLCQGKPSYSGYETPGALWKISMNDATVISSVNFAAGVHPSNLKTDNTSLYYTIDADIFKTDLSAASLPSSALFSTTAQGVVSISAFEINNANIYVGDAGDYNSNGKVYVYSSTGTLAKSCTVGVIPEGFYFNN